VIIDDKLQSGYFADFYPKKYSVLLILVFFACGYMKILCGSSKNPNKNYFYAQQ